MIFKRENETILDFEVNSGTYNKTDTNVEYLDISLYLSHKVDWKKNDTTVCNGKIYYLDETSISEVMDSSVRWSYNLKFYPDYYSALDAMLTLDGRSAFSIDSTLSNLVDLILTSLNRVGSGWTKGVIENTTILHFEFSNNNCMQAIIMLAEAFDVEFSLEDKIIQYTPKVFVPTVQLTYEDDYIKLERTVGADHKIINRVYATGSNENLPSNYDGEYLWIPYREDTTSIARYGLVEGFYSNPDIKPTTKGTVKSTTSNPRLFYVELPYTFDGYIENNTKPIINFETGHLAGLSFYFIPSADPTNTFTDYVSLEPINQSGISIPNANLQASQYDEFNITNIQQPTEVVNEAILKLWEEAGDYLAKHSSFDSEIKIELNVFSDFVPKFNQKINIHNKEYYVKKVVKNLTIPYNYSVELSFFRRKVFSSLLPKINVVISDFINTDIQLQVQLPLAEQRASEAIQLSTVANSNASQAISTANTVEANVTEINTVSLPNMQLDINSRATTSSVTDVDNRVTNTENQLPPIISDVAIANSNASSALDRTQFIGVDNGITEVGSNVRLKYNIITPSGAMGFNGTIDITDTKTKNIVVESGIIIANN